MNWIKTPESSNIARYRYNSNAMILTVEFKNGVAYDYYDVPNMVFDQMMVAASKGQFLAQRIKGVYRYARV